MKKKILFVCFCFFAFFIAAQEATIVLEVERTGASLYDPALVLPSINGQDPEVVSLSENSRSKDGSVTIEEQKGANLLAPRIFVFKINVVKKGAYRFYVSERSTDDDLDMPLHEWGSDARVTITVNGKTQNAVAPEKFGAVWFVASILGDTKDIVLHNSVLPRRKAIFGVAMDAVTGNVIKNVTVNLKDAESGAVVDTTKTRADGKYVFLVERGAYSVEFESPEYITEKNSVRMVTHEFPSRVDAALSPLLLKKEYRVVVSWQDDPRDLDAHLTGPIPQSNETFHVSYRNMRTALNRHFLDRDDLDGFGPETITIKQLDPGLYSFFVHDYTNKSNALSARLSYSGVTVKLYREADLIGEWKPQEGQLGLTWNVFSIDGKTGKVLTENTIR